MARKSAYACVLFLSIFVLAAGCGAADPATVAETTGSTLDVASALDPRQVEAEGLARATFAGGCFWCMEPPFDALDGVLATVSGYAGGDVVNPEYRAVAAGSTGHTEVVQVIYDPRQVSYETLLEVFWRNIDPTVEDRQFCDWGSQYRTAIFAHDAEQLGAATASKSALEQSGRVERVVTQVQELAESGPSAFYPAEEYHQDFYVKDSAHYKRYRKGCGRDARLAELWGEAD